jgi:hypothetical protein
MLKLPLYCDIYIMEMFTCMILKKGTAACPQILFFILLFQIWQIMSWHSFVCVKNQIFQVKKSEINWARPKKKLEKKGRVNVFTINSYMRTHNDMHHEHYEKRIESK